MRSRGWKLKEPLFLGLVSREFLTKYFPADERNHKVIEFMELKQGGISVSEYAAKFEELCRFAPHYNT
ncbi:GRAS family transcription factor, partial [Trifolium medium]|nr:GRAS family transcription factor [Trifolium medium]